MDYIEAGDAAPRLPAGLEADFSGHQAFNICARFTIMDTPTRELVARYSPQVEDFRDRLEGCSSGYSVVKANTMLGFESSNSLVD